MSVRPNSSNTRPVKLQRDKVLRVEVENHHQQTVLLVQSIVAYMIGIRVRRFT